MSFTTVVHVVESSSDHEFIGSAATPAPMLDRSSVRLKIQWYCSLGDVKKPEEGNVHMLT